MKAIVTILNDNDDIVEKDKVVLPVKSYTTIVKGEGGDDRMRIDKHEFSFMYSIMKPFEGRCLM